MLLQESNQSQCFVIAEAGVNHNGSLKIALELVAAAKKSGANAVKFQTFSAERLVTRQARKAEYQEASVPGDKTQYSMLKALELTKSELGNGLSSIESLTADVQGEILELVSLCERLAFDGHDSPTTEDFYPLCHLADKIVGIDVVKEAR